MNDLFFNSSCRALVLGSTGSIGRALVKILKEKIGADNVVSISRLENGLNFMEPATIALEAKKQSGVFDLILDATGALEIKGNGPEKSFQSLEYEIMLDQFKVNAIGPAMIIKHFMKFLPRAGKSVFLTLSARVGSIEDNKLGGWVSYRSSKSALNQIVKTAAIELARKNPESVCIALHPGTVKSKLTERYLARNPYVEPEVAANNIIRVIEGKSSKDSGGFYDYQGGVIPW
jgi:NAD(P)-dependent dehydrogenase (short-subunit alcohol dehydrogenase family)